MNGIHQKHIWLVGKEIVKGLALGKTAFKMAGADKRSS